MTSAASDTDQIGVCVSLASDLDGWMRYLDLVSQVSLVSVSSNDPVSDIIHVTPIQHSDH